MSESMSRDDQIADLMEVLARHLRVRDRLAATRWRTADDLVESAAYHCLFRLNRAPARSGELAEALYSDPSTISRHVAHLVKLGYVRREADPRDGRATILVVTDSGAARVAELKARRAVELESMLADWDDGDVDDLTRLLGKYVGAAERSLATDAVPDVVKS
jgi:DNA-binding MarR family transcriptional regulator